MFNIITGKTAAFYTRGVARYKVYGIPDNIILYFIVVYAIYAYGAPRL